MRYVFEVWKGFQIYHNPQTGQFETEKGNSSYNCSSARYMALQGN